MESVESKMDLITGSTFLLMGLFAGFLFPYLFKFISSGHGELLIFIAVIGLVACPIFFFFSLALFFHRRDLIENIKTKWDIMYLPFGFIAIIGAIFYIFFIVSPLVL